MIRDRLIFVLFYCDGFFVQSRNFRLQKVGDINWLLNSYNFIEVSSNIDELMIVDLSTQKKLSPEFFSAIEKISNELFIPLTIGGGIDSIKKANICFSEGADKLVVNTALYESRLSVEEICGKYGAQSIIASLDYQTTNNEIIPIYKNGSVEAEIDFFHAIKMINEIGVGEVLLNSIGKDGTGFGFDLNVFDIVKERFDTPLILLGGAGNSSHLINGISIKGINAVATGNLFNFLGNGISLARKAMIDAGCNLAEWNGNGKRK